MISTTIVHTLLESENLASGKSAKTARVDQTMKRPKQIAETMTASEMVIVELRNDVGSQVERAITMVASGTALAARPHQLKLGLIAGEGGPG